MPSGLEGSGSPLLHDGVLALIGLKKARIHVKVLVQGPSSAREVIIKYHVYTGPWRGDEPMHPSLSPATCVV